MNYDKQGFDASNLEKQTDTQRAEATANKFFNMADETNPPLKSEQEKYEMFSSAGNEIAQGNYDKAQRTLEMSAQWDDSIRGAASEVNQLDQERIGAKPLSFTEAQKAMRNNARNFEKISKETGGRQQDLESAMEIDNMVSDTSEAGTEAIDNMLKYIEDTLKNKNEIADSILKSDVTTREDKANFLKDWQEKRAMRDSFYKEKQKRTEQIKQSEQVTEELKKGQEFTSRNLENLYAQANVPEDTPSRKELLVKIQRMSPEELYFLDTDLKKTAVEFGRTQDSKMLDGRLMELSSKSFKPKDVIDRQKSDDEKKIEEIRAKFRSNGSTKSKSSGQEVSEQKEKRDNPYEKLFNSSEITNELNSPDITTYRPEKGVAGVVEVLKQLYPDSKRFAARVESLLSDYKFAAEESKRKNPDKDEFAQDAFARKLFVKKMPLPERQALEKFLDENSEKVGGGKKGGVRAIYTPEYVFSDFFDFVKKLK